MADLQTNDPVNAPIETKEQVIQRSDPLALSINDKELVATVNAKVKADHDFYKSKYNLYERRKKNESFLFGRQLAESEDKKELKPYEARYLDNVLYEIESSIKPIAVSRLPDMIITPGNDTKESADTADSISKIVDDDIKLRENRQTLGIAFKHHPVYFTAVIKARWDPQKGEDGDYVFEVRHPDNVVADHTSPTNDAREMDHICDYVPVTVQELVMRFPNKKEQLFAELRKDGLMAGDPEPTMKDMASLVKISEVWFTWYDKPDNQNPENKNKWKRVEGVMWKYGDIVLGKMKDPNFDWEGEEKLFIYDSAGDESTKRAMKPEEMQLALLTGQVPPNATKELVYRNYFDSPQKPYFFMGYDQWHKMPYDETSRIEQNIRNQENLDKQGKVLVEQLRKRIKHIFSKEGGLKAPDIEEMDLDDDGQDILVDGDVHKVHDIIAPERPDASQFKNLDDTRNRMYAISGSNAVRGEIQSDVATTNQIARESDFTRADDLVEDTINAASEWMARWALQFIKLRYTKDHMRRLIGSKTDVTFIKLNRDMIEDGMEVRIKSSGTDKIRAQKNALDMAKLQLTDPLTFYKDLGVSDPEGRAEKLITFQTNPALYVAQFVKDMGTPVQMAQTLDASTQAQDAQLPAANGAVDMANGQVQNPTPTDTSAVPVMQPPIPEGSVRAI